ncbi:MAG: hypothetical protein KVP17_000458 [Porospora cf. gigantea B]|uniref:uncharacterized protein n=1 Tax=Porospora cf. gigantea B TaxID=2853592 RepID=UPI00357182AA|nr:MAG: hypothetical protein KVP17_000458 [Porospora cf. gigantea B]
MRVVHMDKQSRWELLPVLSLHHSAPIEVGEAVRRELVASSTEIERLDASRRGPAGKFLELSMHSSLPWDITNSLRFGVTNDCKNSYAAVIGVAPELSKAMFRNILLHLAFQNWKSSETLAERGLHLHEAVLDHACTRFTREMARVSGFGLPAARHLGEQVTVGHWYGNMASSVVRASYIRFCPQTHTSWGSFGNDSPHEGAVIIHQLSPFASFSAHAPDEKELKEKLLGCRTVIFACMPRIVSPTSIRALANNLYTAVAEFNYVSQGRRPMHIADPGFDLRLPLVAPEIHALAVGDLSKNEVPAGPKGRIKYSRRQLRRLREHLRTTGRRSRGLKRIKVQAAILENVLKRASDPLQVEAVQALIFSPIGFSVEDLPFVKLGTDTVAFPFPYWWYQGRNQAPRQYRPEAELYVQGNAVGGLFTAKTEQMRRRVGWDYKDVDLQDMQKYLEAAEKSPFLHLNGGRYLLHYLHEALQAPGAWGFEPPNVPLPPLLERRT